MGRTFLVLAVVIVAAFVVGVLSANPVVEAVGGWKAAVIELNDDISDIELFLEERSDFWEFLEESGEEFFESQIYEVSAVSLVPVANPGGGNHKGNDVQIRCLDGDWLLVDDRLKPVALSFDASIVLDEETLISEGSIVEESNQNIEDGYSKPIGWDGRAEQVRGFQAVDIPVTITGLCVSPSP